MKTGLFVALCVTALATVGSAATVEVVMNDFLSFSPDPVVVQEGDIVRWTNNAGILIHTSTSGSACAPDGLWDSGNIAAGGGNFLSSLYGRGDV